MSSAVDRDRQPGATAPVRSRRPVLIFVGVLIGIVLTSYAFRIATDAPFLVTGTDPEPEDFEARYVAHPWLAYVHMTPGVLYLSVPLYNCRSGSAPSTTHSTGGWVGCS